MRITRADMMMIGGTSSLVLEASKRDITAFLEKYETKYPIDVEIRLKRKRRSLDANAYCWVLCDMVAEAVGTTKEEVYRSHIREVGLFDDICIIEEAVDDYISRWERKGVGWFCDRFSHCKVPKCEKVRVYYGSSIYDSKQMARLIDNIIHEAKGLGIETMTPDEIERMKQAWNTE